VVGHTRRQAGDTTRCAVAGRWRSLLENDLSKSTYAALVLEQHIQEDMYDLKTREMEAERRIVELIQDVTETIAASATRTQLYSAAFWDLLADEYDDQARQAALKRAAEDSGIDPTQFAAESMGDPDQYPFDAHTAGGND